MRFKNYISRCIAASLLLVFILAATPKRFLHTIFANHTDEVCIKSSDKNHQSFSNQTYHCQIDNLVVELPFFSSTSFLFCTSIQHVERFQEHYVFEIIDNNQLVDSSRGPPVYC